MPTDEDDKDDQLPTVCRSHGMHVREVRADERSIRVVASTDAIDSYDEIVEQIWDLKRFKSNPVILYGHRSRELPIGKGIDVGLVNGNLEATIQFVSEKANPLAENVFQLFKEGALNAVSVGFRPRDVRLEKRNDQEVFVLSDNELWEISVVPIPANPEALSKMRQLAAGAALKKTIQVPIHIRVTTKPDSPKPAEPPAQPKETTMTVEEQQALAAKNAELLAKCTQYETDTKTVTAKLTETEKALATEKATVATLNERCATLETARADQQKRADDLAEKDTARDLKELTGVKIAPAEVPGLIKLSKLSQELYLEQLTAIKARPDMQMLERTVKTEGEIPPSSVEKTGTDDGGDDLMSAVNKRIQSESATN